VVCQWTFHTPTHQKSTNQQRNRGPFDPKFLVQDILLCHRRNKFAVLMIKGILRAQNLPDRYNQFHRPKHFQASNHGVLYYYDEDIREQLPLELRKI
jgi:hypothetical protein